MVTFYNRKGNFVNTVRHFFAWVVRRFSGRYHFGEVAVVERLKIRLGRYIEVQCMTVFRIDKTVCSFSSQYRVGF